MSSDENYYMEDEDESPIDYIDYPSSESLSEDDEDIEDDYSDGELSLAKCEEILEETKFKSELRLSDNDYYYQYVFPNVKEYIVTHMPLHYFFLDISKLLKINNTLNQNLDIAFTFNDKYIEKYINTLIDETDVNENFGWILTERNDFIHSFDNCIDFFIRNKYVLFKTKIKRNQDHPFFRLFFKMVKTTTIKEIRKKYSIVIPSIISCNIQRKIYLKHILKDIFYKIQIFHKCLNIHNNKINKLNSDVVDVIFIKILKKYNIKCDLFRLTKIYEQIAN